MILSKKRYHLYFTDVTVFKCDSVQILFQVELEEKYKELEKRCAALDLELIEAKDRNDELENELMAIRQLQVQRYR